jgi:hypothetical protein
MLRGLNISTVACSFAPMILTSVQNKEEPANVQNIMQAPYALYSNQTAPAWHSCS